ncbi:MAG: gamma-glutamylcyclotransferase [Sedimenticola sp.]|nr:gamma-glutamylcyclotransferase [Sedimenticola sp.]
MRYFAYGSNMSTRRLAARIDSARRLSVAHLSRHDLRWHKQGRDGSGKCDVHYTGEERHVVIGVMFEIDERDKPLLDRFEGLGNGYRELVVDLRGPAGERWTAFTYQATLTAPDIRPYQWYKRHVLEGALEHGLPSQYVEQLRMVAAQEDPDPERHARELCIYVRADT